MEEVLQLRLAIVVLFSELPAIWEDMYYLLYWDVILNLYHLWGSIFKELLPICIDEVLFAPIKGIISSFFRWMFVLFSELFPICIEDVLFAPSWGSVLFSAFVRLRSAFTIVSTIAQRMLRWGHVYRIFQGECIGRDGFTLTSTIMSPDSPRLRSPIVHESPFPGWSMESMIVSDILI